MTEEKAEKSDVAKREEGILQFWQEKQIFEKSLSKESPKGNFVFYDGPPFATGLPHFGHLLPTSLKDAVPRYQTMRGFHVERRWGWDCHGLPIENLIERELGLATKKDIEAYGIDKFNQKARESVLRYADEWKKIIPRMGRWVDMENDYKTMHWTYTESVWWAFKTLHDKELVYEGYKSMHLCPRCETTLANFEVNQGYKDIVDLAVTVKFELVDEPGTYLLAWTTTPWTLPGNVALAVNPSTNYVRIKANDTSGESYILAKERLESVMKDQKYEIVEELAGRKLVGQKYKTVFDYYLKEGQVYGADFVTTEDGTGIVHIAPAFGEDDLALGQKNNLPFIQHVGTDGRFKSEVKDFAGLSVKPKDDHQSSDILVIKYLAKAGTLFAKEKITHPYPHCWRCDTPLLNYAASSWFVGVTKIKDRLVALNQDITWVPEYIKAGRFGKWLEGARDWAVSRSRYWGAPLPVWRCEECKKMEVLGSLEEIKEKTRRNNYFLMRHGQSEKNLEAIISTKDLNVDPLTSLGREQAKIAAQNFKLGKFDRIISSPLLRARQTAEIVADSIGYDKDKIIVDERLREVKALAFDGQTWDERNKNYASREDFFTKNIAGDENLLAIKQRVADFIYDVDARYNGENILIVGHGAPTGVFPYVAQGLNLQELMETHYQGQPKNAEIMPFSFSQLPHNENYELDLHRPYIDEIKLSCDCGGEMKRVPEVFDVWFESGSMPYGQRHYPFEHQEEFKQNFPADFIAEGLDQTRGWFYVLLVLAAGLFDQSPYKRVIVNGLILAEDGQKMSKRLNNFPPVVSTIDQYGADALRLYLLSSPAVHAEEFNFSERGLREMSNRVLGRLRNVLAFYELYAGAAQTSDVGASLTSDVKSGVLDQWITTRLNQLIAEVTTAMEASELDRAIRPIDSFIDDLSTWYLRRSRERLKSEAGVLRQVLLELAKVMAPLAPFIAEEIYQKLKGDKESVHLENWLEGGSVDQELIEQMAQTRELVSRGLELRAKANIKIRQPLAALTIDQDLPAEFQELIKDEVNVESVMVDPKLFALDTNLTPELKEKGELRDLIRELQDWRKEQGLKPGEPALAPIPAGREALVKKYAGEFQKICYVTFAPSH